MVDVTEILIHWYAGRSLSEVSDSLGVDRKTIRYAAPLVMPRDAEDALAGEGGPTREFGITRRTV